MSQKSGADARDILRPSDSRLRPADLFHFDGCTRISELLLNSFGLFFRNGFLDGLWSSLDKILGFFQTERSYLPNDFDDVDLVAAYGLQDHVKLGLLFCRSRRLARAAPSSRSCHCRRGG